LSSAARSLLISSIWFHDHASLLQALFRPLRLPARAACVPSPARPLPSGARYRAASVLSRTQGRPHVLLCRRSSEPAVLLSSLEALLSSPSPCRWAVPSAARHVR